MVQKSVVAFCGDGLNDTAALETADVGYVFLSSFSIEIILRIAFVNFRIALSHGSQITLGSASFVLLSTSSVLASLPKLLQLSAKVYKRQKVNFAWAMVSPLIFFRFSPLNLTICNFKCRFITFVCFLWPLVYFTPQEKHVYLLFGRLLQWRLVVFP
jgi:magnesium-transporting ATPase (P-type)